MAVLALVAVAAAGGIYAGLRLASDDAQPAVTPTLPPTSTTDAVTVALSAEQIAAEYGPAVWRVESTGCGEFWTGTAFAIDEHHFVTNHHVVANDTRPILINSRGDRLEATVVGWSERPDIALVRVETTQERWLQWAPTGELSEGQDIVALGYPVPATDFTATPGSILSFQSRTGLREAIRTNAALDRGNSGGPALDVQGRVVGVVTEMAPNLGGFQLVPLIFTHDAVVELITQFLDSPSEPQVDCADSSRPGDGPGSEDPETWDSDADTRGDDPMLDRLWDQCELGDFEACDDLWYLAPPGSGYEEFGDTCGQRNAPSGWCADIYS